MLRDTFQKDFFTPKKKSGWGWMQPSANPGKRHATYLSSAKSVAAKLRRDFPRIKLEVTDGADGSIRTSNQTGKQKTDRKGFPKSSNPIHSSNPRPSFPTYITFKSTVTKDIKGRAALGFSAETEPPLHLCTDADTVWRLGNTIINVSERLIPAIQDMQMPICNRGKLNTDLIDEETNLKNIAAAIDTILSNTPPTSTGDLSHTGPWSESIRWRTIPPPSGCYACPYNRGFHLSRPKRRSMYS